MEIRIKGNWLKRAYKGFNKNYFGNKLPKKAKVYWADMKGDMGVQIGLDRIAINRELKRWPRIALETLLHEMVHLAMPYDLGHSKKFKKRIKKLVYQGAYDSLL